MMQMTRWLDAIEREAIRGRTVSAFAAKDDAHCFLGLSGPEGLSARWFHPICGIYKHIHRTSTGKHRAPRNCSLPQPKPIFKTTSQKHNVKAKRQKGTHCPPAQPDAIAKGSGVYNYKPSPRATALYVDASTGSGAVTVIFPDGWLYIWTGATSVQLQLLFTGPIGKYTAGQIAQGVVLTDEASAHACLYRFTSGRLFQILGSPDSKTKGSPPIGISIFWGNQIDWTQALWTFANIGGTWAGTTSPASGVMSDTASFTSTASATTGQWEWRGAVSFKGAAQNCQAIVNWAATSVPAIFELYFYVTVDSGATTVFQATTPAYGFGTHTFNFTTTDTGGAAWVMNANLGIYNGSGGSHPTSSSSVVLSTV
jgi:hypothetical protein